MDQESHVLTVKRIVDVTLRRQSATPIVGNALASVEMEPVMQMNPVTPVHQNAVNVKGAVALLTTAQVALIKIRWTV